MEIKVDVMVTWDELSEFLTNSILLILNAIWNWMTDMLDFIFLEIRNVIVEMIYFIIIILRGVFKGIIYLGIIYFILWVFDFETAIDYGNSQIIIEPLSKIIKYLNDNGGAIQAIATAVLVIITARYVAITHRMLKLEEKKHFLERMEIWKKEAKEREREREYKSNIGIRQRKY